MEVLGRAKRAAIDGRRFTNTDWLDLISSIQDIANQSSIPSLGGNSGKFLTNDGTSLSWATVSGGGGGLTDPLTTDGDIIARISGVTTRLGSGSNGTFLGVNNSGVLGYYSITSVSSLLISNLAGTGSRMVVTDASGNLSPSSLTLPATGTLVTLAGIETLTNKTINGVVLASAGNATLYLNQFGTYTSIASSGGVIRQLITSSTTLNTSSSKIYTIFIDASAGNVVVTLPTGDDTVCHIIRRIDNTSNTVTFSGTVSDFGTSGTNLLGNSGFILTYNSGNTTFYAN